MKNVKKLSFALLVTCALALPLAATAQPAAQPTPTPVVEFPSAKDSKDDDYLKYVAGLGAPEKVDWARVRALYVQTSFYDPYGGAQAIWYGLQQLGQRMTDDPSPANVRAYQDMLNRHYAHYRAHLQAFDLAGKTGSPHINRSAHEKALHGILRSILVTGDGKTPESAYKVIDPVEEQMILKTYRYRQRGQDFRQKDGHFWDVVKYTNPQTNLDGELFFNVDTILMAQHKR